MLPFPRKFFRLLLLTLLGVTTLQAADAQKIAFYVQLVRGTDSDKPEDPAWKPVGAKLGRNLRGVFRWTNYWEVKSESLTLSKDKVARLHLTREREVEVKLLDPPRTQIRLYNKGELTRCSHQPISEHMCILGGDAQSGESWFVVVRRDRPLEKE